MAKLLQLRSCSAQKKRLLFDLSTALSTWGHRKKSCLFFDKLPREIRNMIYIQLFAITTGTRPIRHLSSKQADDARKWDCRFAKLVLKYKLLSLALGDWAQFRLEEIPLRVSSAPLKMIDTAIFATNSVIAAEAREMFIKHCHLKISIYRDVYSGVHLDLPWPRKLASKFRPTLYLDHILESLKLDIAHRDAHRDIVLHAPKLYIEVNPDTTHFLARLLRQRGGPLKQQQLNIDVFFVRGEDIPSNLDNSKGNSVVYTRLILDALEKSRASPPDDK